MELTQQEWEDLRWCVTNSWAAMDSWVAMEKRDRARELLEKLRPHEPAYQVEEDVIQRVCLGEPCLPTHHHAVYKVRKPGNKPIAWFTTRFMAHDFRDKMNMEEE